MTKTAIEVAKRPTAVLVASALLREDVIARVTVYAGARGVWRVEWEPCVGLEDRCAEIANAVKEADSRARI